MNNNQLTFKVYESRNKLLVMVDCHEGIGAELTFTPNYEKFMEKHPTTADNLCKLLDSLNEVFKHGDVEGDIELVRMTMSMIEGIPFGFLIEYLEDTVSPKLNKHDTNDYSIQPIPDIFNSLPMGMPGMMQPMSMDNFMLGSKPPKKGDEPKKNKRTTYIR